MLESAWKTRCRARGGVPVDNSPKTWLNWTGRADACRFMVAGRPVYRSPEKTLLETLATIKKEAEHRLGKAQSDVVIDATGIVEGVANLPGDILRAAFRSPLALLGLAGLALVFWPAISLQVRRLTK